MKNSYTSEDENRNTPVTWEGVKIEFVGHRSKAGVFEFEMSLGGDHERLIEYITVSVEVGVPKREQAMTPDTAYGFSLACIGIIAKRLSEQIAKSVSKS
jgi:hypothetical protein